MGPGLLAHSGQVSRPQRWGSAVRAQAHGVPVPTEWQEADVPLAAACPEEQGGAQARAGGQGQGGTAVLLHIAHGPPAA